MVEVLYGGIDFEFFFLISFLLYKGDKVDSVLKELEPFVV
jgi:hypothetical protein